MNLTDHSQSSLELSTLAHDTLRKALEINMDRRRYGTFAEIGAGQEVVRWFFHAGGAAGTVAKSISAYDMSVSDAIYGKTQRYVSRDRLQSMLDYEQRLNLSRLGDRAETSALFVFADTVATRAYHDRQEGRGWMGVKFQAHPRDQDSQIVLHLRMLDRHSAQQQEALGIVGVNLLYGAFFHYYEPEALLRSLLDGLSTDRVEIDMIEFSGIEFRYVDNRMMSLRLVELGFSDAAMFAPTGQTLQPSDVLHNRAVLVERGSFRPVTNVHMDMLQLARRKFREHIRTRSRPEPASAPAAAPPREPLELMEITMHNLLTSATGGTVDPKDFLARADMLAACGQTVLISNYSEFYRLSGYLTRYTRMPVAMVMGAASLRDLFDEKYYRDLEGGILESFGRLFKNDHKLYIYPWLDPATGQLTTMENLAVAPSLRPLYGYLVGRGFIEPLENYHQDYLPMFSSAVLEKIKQGDSAWVGMVPPPVAELIQKRALLGFRPPTGGS